MAVTEYVVLTSRLHPERTTDTAELFLSNSSHYTICLLVPMYVSSYAL